MQVGWRYLLHSAMGLDKWEGAHLQASGHPKMKAWDGEVVSRSAVPKSKAGGLDESDVLAVKVQVTGKAEMSLTGKTGCWWEAGGGV